MLITIISYYNNDVLRWLTPHVIGVNWPNSFMEKNWGNASIVKKKLYCDVNIFQKNALKLVILYNTLHWTFYVIISLSLGCIHFCTYICVFTAKEEHIQDFDGKCCRSLDFLTSQYPNQYSIFLEKFSNFILYRPNKEIYLFLRNFPLNLNMCAIWFPV